MGKIHELAPNLADQIAAGEVVERPASVVKELVENAIDAHATTIDIVVEEAGLKSIQVMDNGDGIPADEVKLAFKRHATSKISAREDLFKVQTLGFRGEALPSIASIADVQLTTATTDQPGTAIHLKGGTVLEFGVSASRPGTTITVTELFYNTPARLKYLGSLATELAAVSDIVNRLALGHPEIAFSLTNNGHQLLQTAGNGNLQQVIGAIYGVQSARQMLAITGEDHDFKVTGFVSLPKLTRAARKYISLLINGRYIKNFQLTKALIKGYGSKLMIGRYPIAVLNIELNPLLVDVNVHPTKQEVRISKEEQLTHLIETTIANRLTTENLIPDALENLHANKKVDLVQLQAGMAAAFEDSQTDKREKQLSEAGSTAYHQPQEGPLGTSAEVREDAGPEPPTVIIKNKADLTKPLVQKWDQKYSVQKHTSATEPNSELVPAEQTEAEETARFPELKYIGQMHGTYLLAESPAGLYIVDQHAAQERIKYEYFRQKIGEVSPDQQKLLLPIVLTYPVTDMVRIKPNLEKLAQLGIVLEDFGPNSYVVRQHPTWFIAGQEEDTIKEMIDYFLQDQQLSIAKFREKTAIMMSCKRAIKANQHLDDRQAKALLTQLNQCENPFNCPHGRPTLVHFTSRDIERMFKRIQDPHHTDFIDKELK